MIAPKWVQSLYTRFPLVKLEQEDEPRKPDGIELWIEPGTTHPHSRWWASSAPNSLRTQLLFLLRGVKVGFRPWKNALSAPQSTLPALLIGEKLLGANEIRTWLDKEHPLDKLQGMPSEVVYDQALALAQLVLTRLYPAYLASLSNRDDLHLLLSTPPPLSAGLTTPLPASLTGDARDLDLEEIVRKGVDALPSLEFSGWALGAKSPTPLDALLASHLYGVYSLPDSSILKQALAENDVLGDYVDRVMEIAGARV